MPMTGFITRSAAALLLACLLAGLLFSTPARAGDCGRLCDEAFWQTATPQQVEAEIARGADPNGRDEGGFTPLHQAAFWEKPEAIKALVRAGADLEAKTNTTTFHGAPPLHWAARGRIAATVALLDAGADPNSREIDGWTPLHQAAQYGTDKIIKSLVQAGANLEARDKYDETPLHWAAQWGTVHTVTALLDAGANPKAKDQKGRTPFDLAKDNDDLTGTDAWWRLHDARFD